MLCGQFLKHIKYINLVKKGTVINKENIIKLNLRKITSVVKTFVYFNALEFATLPNSKLWSNSIELTSRCLFNATEGDYRFTLRPSVCLSVRLSVSVCQSVCLSVCPLKIWILW